MIEESAVVPPGDAPARKAGRPPIVLIAIVAGGLLAGTAVGVFVVGPMVARPGAAAAADSGEGGGAASRDEHGKPRRGGRGEKPTLYRIENLIVNPAGSNGQRFLMASVVLEFQDAKLEEEARNREVELRDAVISTLESQSLEALSQLGARDSLRTRLRARLRPIIGEQVDFRVFLPQYVIQ